MAWDHIWVKGYMTIYGLYQYIHVHGVHVHNGIVYTCTCIIINEGRHPGYLIERFRGYLKLQINIYCTGIYNMYIIQEYIHVSTSTCININS